MSHVAVVGLGFGDEGKGLMTDFLASRHPHSLNVRFSGGHQVGHNVVSKGISHVFSNFGSGTIQGLPTYWSEHCPVCPIGLMNELDVLRSKGVKPKIYIHRDSPIVTPMDRDVNRTDDKKSSHGTCGVGFGATIQREEDFYSLKFMDIFYPKVFRAKLESICKNYYKPEEFDFEEFLGACEELRNLDCVTWVSDMPIGFDEYLFEGSQGLLLDQHYGFFPNVTRSNIGSKNIAKYAEDTEWFLITRAYQTRHGNGFMTNEEISHNIRLDENETNVTNEYQGEFRRTLLDVDLLIYAMAKDLPIMDSPNVNLVITCIDHIENEYRFTYQGEVVSCCDEDEFVKSVSSIMGIESVYTSASNDGSTIRRRVSEKVA